MNDLIAEVDEVLASEGLKFEVWRPLFNNAPARSGTPYFDGRWAWDMLPGYATQINWADPELRKGHRRRVVVQAVADSGRNYDGKEPDPGDFEPAEASRTELRIGLWTTTAARPAWDAAWEVISAKTDDALDQQNAEVEGEHYTFEYRGINVADLVDGAATKARVLDMLGDWARSQARGGP